MARPKNVTVAGVGKPSGKGGRKAYGDGGKVTK